MTENQWEDWPPLANDLMDCGVEFMWFYHDRGWHETPRRCNRIQGHDGQHLWITK